MINIPYNLKYPSSGPRINGFKVVFKEKVHYCLHCDNVATGKDRAGNYTCQDCLDLIDKQHEEKLSRHAMFVDSYNGEGIDTGFTCGDCINFIKTGYCEYYGEYMESTESYMINDNEICKGFANKKVILSSFLH